MRFLLDAEQRAFAASLDALLTASDTPAVIRDWSRGEHASGRALWSRLAEAGVFALAVPETYEGGLGPRPVELAVAFVELGRHAVPGPLVETVAAAVILTGADPGIAKRLLPVLASGGTMATVGPDGPTPKQPADRSREPDLPSPPQGPYALDGDAATLRLSWEPDGIRLSPGHGPVRPSLD
ncbi:acyl-CoA dehydrogenase family protein, partial [Streptomyces swartbergensis]